MIIENRDSSVTFERLLLISRKRGGVIHYTGCTHVGDEEHARCCSSSRAAFRIEQFERVAAWPGHSRDSCPGGEAALMSVIRESRLSRALVLHMLQRAADSELPAGRLFSNSRPRRRGCLARPTVLFFFAQAEARPRAIATTWKYRAELEKRRPGPGPDISCAHANCQFHDATRPYGGPPLSARYILLSLSAVS